MLTEASSRAPNSCPQAVDMDKGRWPSNNRARQGARASRTARRRLDRSRLQSGRKVSYLTYSSNHLSAARSRIYDQY